MAARSGESPPRYGMAARSGESPPRYGRQKTSDSSSTSSWSSQGGSPLRYGKQNTPNSPNTPSWFSEEDSSYSSTFSPSFEHQVDSTTLFGDEEFKSPCAAQKPSCPLKSTVEPKVYGLPPLPPNKSRKQIAWQASPIKSPSLDLGRLTDIKLSRKTNEGMPGLNLQFDEPTFIGKSRYSGDLSPNSEDGSNTSLDSPRSSPRSPVSRQLSPASPSAREYSSPRLRRKISIGEPQDISDSDSLDSSQSSEGRLYSLSDISTPTSTPTTSPSGHGPEQPEPGDGFRRRTLLLPPTELSPFSDKSNDTSRGSPSASSPYCFVADDASTSPGLSPLKSSPQRLSPQQLPPLQLPSPRSRHGSNGAHTYSPSKSLLPSQDISDYLQLSPIRSSPTMQFSFESSARGPVTSSPAQAGQTPSPRDQRQLEYSSITSPNRSADGSLPPPDTRVPPSAFSPEAKIQRRKLSFDYSQYLKTPPSTPETSSSMQEHVESADDVGIGIARRRRLTYTSPSQLSDTSVYREGQTTRTPSQIESQNTSFSASSPRHRGIKSLCCNLATKFANIEADSFIEASAPTRNIGNVQSLTGSTFSRFIKEQGLVAVMFHNSSINKPGSLGAWKTHSLKGPGDANPVFASVDCATEAELCAREAITTQPFFKLYDGGYLVNSVKDFRQLNYNT
ncbi:hypothetical protein BsWGS_17010 [Bradybaena similaris]